MAGTELDLRSLNKGLRAVERASLNHRSVWSKLRKPMRVDQRDHMKQQQDSGGSKWKLHAPSTREARLSRGGRAGKHTKRGKLKKGAARKLNRILSARLVSGARFKSTPSAIELKSKVPWAGIHQKGGIAGRGSRMPPREFFWISDPLADQAADLIAERLAHIFNRNG